MAPAGSSRRVLARRTGRSPRRSGASGVAPRQRTVAGAGSRADSCTSRRASRSSTPGGALVCTLVDDVTLVADLDLRTRPAPGWYRVLTDDARLLRLLAERIDPGAPIDESLDPIAALWGVRVDRHGEVFQLDDSAGATIALAAPQGGGRERGCEVITPPLTADHEAAIDELLRVARDLGFVVPTEAAVHVHLDGAPFRSAPALANVVRLFGLWRPALHALLGTNPACRRLAPLPASLVQAAAGHTVVRATPRRRNRCGPHEVLRCQPDRAVRAESGARHGRGADSCRAPSTPATSCAGLRSIEALLERCLDETPIPAPPADLAVALCALRAMAGEGALLLAE